jgi:hypothetical protein
LLQAERRTVETARDAAAARQALPEVEVRVAGVAARVRDLAQRRNAAHRAAVLEVVGDYIRETVVPAIGAIRDCELTLRSCQLALTGAGDQAATTRFCAGREP